MNRNKQKYSIILFAAVISSSLVFATSIGRTATFQGAVAQQQQQQQNATTNTTSIISNQTNGIANQTGEAVTTASMQNQTISNQTGRGAAALANLTQTDFESITEDLAEARQALQNNDTTRVLDELSSASEELFQVISGQSDPDHMAAITEQFKSLQTHMDQGRAAVLKNDHTKTLSEINSADSELLKITQELPSSEEEED
jgi:uncharacterized membrane protein YfhO